MSIIFKMSKYLKRYSNLMKTCIIIALVIVLAIQGIVLHNYKSSYKEEVSVLQTELDSLKIKNEELETKVSKQEETLAKNENVLLDKDEQIHQLQTELQESQQIQGQSFKSDGDYNQARQVWNYLRDLGLNKYVCAGIMGNIMAEVGGQTLDISRWPQYSQKNYYGICQWAGSRKQRLLNDYGTTLEDQIRFLSVELFEVIPKGNSFYNMQDEQQAALYFAKYYERCGSGSYAVRQSNATKALQYFAK